MARPLSKIGEILNLANNSATDRRKFLKELHNVYANDTYVKAIHAETAKSPGSSLSWDRIMLTVHQIAVLEVDKAPANNTTCHSATTTQNNCSTLMLETTRLAGAASDVSLSYASLMSIVIPVLENNLYRVYLDTYLDILVRCVLEREIFRLKITSERWREIFKLCTGLFEGSSDVVKNILLKAMKLVVQYGCQQSHLMLDVKGMLPILDSAFRDIGKRDEFMLRRLYTLTYTVCLEIGTECRSAVCEFGESIISSIIYLEGCPEMYKMLLLLIEIYHPNGMADLMNEDSNGWKTIIRGIYGNMVRNIKAEKLGDCFLQVCCEAYREMLREPTYLAEATMTRDVGTSREEHNQARKTRRLTIERPADMLLMKNNLPYVEILTVLLNKYPDTLNSSDYPEFLKNVTESIGKSFKDDVMLGSLCKLSTVLVKIEKKHYNEALEQQTENVRMCWQQIWETVVRATSMNRNQILCHELLRSIIQHRNVMNSQSLLRLYLKRTIAWSSSSVETLLTLWTYVNISSVNCEVFDPSEETGAIRNSLLQWTLDGLSATSSAEIPIISLSQLLTSLAIKSTQEREFQRSENQRNIVAAVFDSSLESELLYNRESRAKSDIERCNLTRTFQHDPFDNAALESTPRIPRTETRITSDSHETIEDILKALVDALVETLAKITVKKSVKNTQITKVTVVAKILSNFAELNVEFEGEPISRLVAAFREAYKNILSAFMRMSNTNLGLSSAEDEIMQEQEREEKPIEVLERFYHTRYHAKVEKAIVELTSMDFIKYINELLVSVENLEKRKIHDSGACPELKRVRNSAENIIIYYCCACIGDEASASQMNVLKDFMNIAKTCRCSLRSTTNCGCIRRILRLLSAFGLSDRASRTSQSFEITISFMDQVLKIRGEDERIVRGVLQVVPRLIKATLPLTSATSISSSSTDALVDILRKIHKYLGTERYGPLVHSEFVKCLAQVIRVNPLLQYRSSKQSEASRPIIQLLISYIGNPFYAVRLDVARAICEIFSMKQLDVPWKLEFLEKVIIAVDRLFVNDEKKALSADELATRRVSALLVLAGVIRGNESRQLHSRALIAMIELTVKRDVGVTTMKQALLLSTTRKDTDEDRESWPRRLVEMNLRALLLRWLEADRRLERFPWILTDCVSHEDFSRRYIEILATIKLQRLEFEHLEHFCKNIGVSFIDTIENSFAPIMTLLTSMMVGREKTAAIYARDIHEKLRANFGEFSEIKRFNDLLEEKLSQVVVDIIKRLHDRRHFGAMFESAVSLPDNHEHVLSFHKDTVDRCLQSLEKDLDIKKNSLIEYLVTRRPSVLQKILLELTSQIYDVRSTEDEPRAFYRYAYFYGRVFENLSKPYFDDMSLYVVKDAAHSLLCFVTAEESLVSEMACCFLEKFLRVALPDRANQVKEILSFTVSSLIPGAQSGKVEGAMSLLRYLIIGQRQVLAEAIEKLGSFPDHENFMEIKRVYYESKYGEDRDYSLKKEIQHFLDAIDEKTLCCTRDGLAHLNDELSRRKDELRQLYSELEALRGFSEDCTSSTLHRLIYRLVRLTRSSDADISLEAARCLGQLGPADLATVILHPENEFGKERHHPEDINKEHRRVDNFTVSVINHLSEYLVDRNIALRKASAKALHTIFSTCWAGKFTIKSNLDEMLVHLYGIEHSTLYQCIFPFARSNDSKSRFKSPVPIRIDGNGLQTLLERSIDLWIPKGYDTFSKWMLDLISRILDCFQNFYTKALMPVCTHSIEFSKMLLPRLIYLLVDTDDSVLEDLCSCINRFFQSIGEIDSTTNRNSSSSNNCKDDGGNDDHLDVSRSFECVHSMLSIVNFMRLYSIEKNKPLSLDYLFLAYAADYASAYFTSLLYAELACQTLAEEPEFLRENQPGSWLSAIDAICEFHPTAGKLLQHVIRKASLHIGDPDSIYGCGLSNTIDSSFRAQHYTHREQWDKVILEQDMELNCSDSASRRDMLNALEQSERRYLGGLLVTTGKRQADNVDDYMYKAAWRLTDWSALESQKATSSAVQHFFPISQKFKSNDYHASHYHVLECLRDRNVVGLTNALANARRSVVGSLRKTNLECSKAMYPALSKLQMLREVEEFVKCNDELLGEWHEQDFTDTHDLRYIEPILSQRIAMYQMQKCDKKLAESMDFGLVDTYMKIARVAEKQGHLSTASRALHILGEKIDLSVVARHELTYQKALLAWKEEERDISRYLLKDLIKQPTLGANLRVKALRICGNLMAESTSENPQTIIKNYYEESIKTCSKLEPSSNNDKTLTDARASLGEFAHAQYQQIIRFTKLDQRVHSTKFSRDDEIARRTGNRSYESPGDADVTDAMNTYQQQVTDDDFKFEDAKRERDTYLILAANNYLLTLQNNNDHDFLVFRLVSLWLDNNAHEQLNEILRENLPRIASWKFVTLLCQIAPHMSNVSSDFTVIVHDLMERCAKEHPHHTLPILLALKNTHKDEEFIQVQRGSQKHSKSRPEPRVIAAESLLSELKSSEIRYIIQEISLLSNALIMLAYYKLSKEQEKKTGVPHGIPRQQAIMRIRDFQHTIVPTISLAVNPSGNYENIVGIAKYKSTFEIPGGLNAPKNIVCVGTDGIERRQLVKGKDDLRQDAVMQQVCTVMNSMLKTSRETKRRRLHIRTYKIVPLSRRSGVLEWCEKTRPIAHILTDIGRVPGLHTKYYPNDWSVNRCRQKIAAVMNQPRDVRLKTFLECCENLHPAFHHFFLEKYPSAEMWFERRLAYTRSVATTSMVGYILGLGDRHFSNILLDETTAEVIHIDFGIAFAQGTVLPVPETVPFRLTRDMEVAMGICGVEGVMRRSCEETVAVLRNRRETLITMLQVLLYDPLFSWAITPVQPSDLETCSSLFTHGFAEVQEKKNTNKIAEKALLRIDEKLQGTADGRALSITGQVERLIQQARDPVNLCRLFAGWQAYL